MPGLLSFHAHPDDEVIQTGGILAQAAADGRPTMVLTATDGAEGEVHNYDDPDSIKPTKSKRDWPKSEPARWPMPWRFSGWGNSTFWAIATRG